MTSTLYALNFDHGTFVVCACDEHRPKMLEIRGGEVRVKDGEHTVHVPTKDLVELLAGTTGEAAVAYVMNLFK